MRKIFFLFSISSLALGACKKDSEPVPDADVRTSLLLAHEWKLSAQTLTFNQDGKADIMDIYASITDCSRDNTTKFNSDRSLTFAEGATSCYPAAQTQTGSWSFNKDQTELAINGPQFTGIDPVFQVLDLTERTLQIRTTYTYRQNGHDYTGVQDYTFTAL